MIALSSCCIAIGFHSWDFKLGVADAKRVEVDLPMMMKEPLT